MSRAAELAKLVRERGLTGCMTLGYEIAAELERLARLDEQSTEVKPDPPSSRCVHTSLDDFYGCAHGQRDFVPVKQIPSELFLMKGFWESADGERVHAMDLCDEPHAARRFRPFGEPWMAVTYRAMFERYRNRQTETHDTARELRAFARFIEEGIGESVVPASVAQSLIVSGPPTGWKAVIDGEDIRMRHPPYLIHACNRSIVLKTINLLLKAQPPCSHPFPTS